MANRLGSRSLSRLGTSARAMLGSPLTGSSNRRVLKGGSLSEETLRAALDDSAGSSKDATLRLFETVVHAMAQRDSAVIVPGLVSRDPKVLDHVDDDGWTLLHHCCNSQPDNTELLDYLLQQSPSAALKLTKEGKVAPLHLACLRGASLTAIKMLVEAAPKSVRMIDAKGWTPLSFACSANANSQVMRYLIGKWPISCLVVDVKGRYPMARLEKQLDQLDDVEDEDEYVTSVIELVTDATADAAFALIDASLNHTSGTAVPESVRTHVRDTIPDMFASQANVFQRSHWLCHSPMGRKLIKRLLKNDDLQTMLRNTKHEESQRIFDIMQRNKQADWEYSNLDFHKGTASTLKTTVARATTPPRLRPGLSLPRHIASRAGPTCNRALGA